MFSSLKPLTGVSPRLIFLIAAIPLALASLSLQAQPRFDGIGRAATPKEVAAWDIDVRPDFKGLPKGSGSVAQGQDIWEAKCASCHGVFGEATEVFNPLIGGTTKADVESGRTANLRREDYPARSTIMKVATLSTLWDYIHRAMPWTQPKSLKPSEVYAVTAYMLNLADVVPADFVLSDTNMAEAQKRLPNRHGMSTAHGMWPSKALGGTPRPDAQGSRCMRDCATEPKIASFLPEYARNAHGNLAEQNRLIGPQRGAKTDAPENKTQISAMTMAQVSPASHTAVASPSAASPAKPAAAKAESADLGKQALALAQKHHCTGCHAQAAKLVGPSWNEIAKKHTGKVDYLAGKIRAGGTGAWGAIPMPAQNLNEADAKTIAQWLAQGAAR